MITFNELLERAETEKIAIHTRTEKQAKALLKALDKRGYRWTEGIKLNSTTWYGVFRKDTCYSFYDYYRKLQDKEVRYCSFNWYKNEGYTIIEFKDIDWKGDWYILV